MSTPAQPQPTIALPDSTRSNSAHFRGKHPKHKLGSMMGASVSSATESLWANRMRSLLTTLGVIIGVMAVIVAVTLTQGAGALLTQRISSLGTNTLLISPGAAVSGGATTGIGTQQSLTLDDVEAIKKVPHVTAVSPVLSLTAQIITHNQNWNTRVQGVAPEFQQIQNWLIARGVWFSASDAESGLPVAVLGDTVATNLFSATNTDPIGQTILIRGQVFRVVGVLQPKGAFGAFNQDDIVYIPFNAAASRLKNTQYVDQIQAQVDNADNVATAQDAVTSVLRHLHRIAPGAVDDFQLRSPNQLVQTAQQFAQILTILLVGIAAISLTVGGIGIMNIMLVSVTERTREIGIRMAIGARQRDIRNQFLIEALALSAVGGIIGILLGLLIGFVLTSSFQLPFVVDPISTCLAFGVSAAIGVIFGLYPAIRASRLDPIVALRTD